MQRYGKFFKLPNSMWSRWKSNPPQSACKANSPALVHAAPWSVGDLRIELRMSSCKDDVLNHCTNLLCRQRWARTTTLTGISRTILPVNLSAGWLTQHRTENIRLWAGSFHHLNYEPIFTLIYYINYITLLESCYLVHLSSSKTYRTDQNTNQV